MFNFLTSPILFLAFSSLVLLIECKKAWRKRINEMVKERIAERMAFLEKAWTICNIQIYNTLINSSVGKIFIDETD